jgi:hypothetical protein
VTSRSPAVPDVRVRTLWQRYAALKKKASYLVDHAGAGQRAASAHDAEIEGHFVPMS